MPSEANNHNRLDSSQILLCTDNKGSSVQVLAIHGSNGRHIKMTKNIIGKRGKSLHMPVYENKLVYIDDISLKDTITVQKLQQF